MAECGLTGWSPDLDIIIRELISEYEKVQKEYYETPLKAISGYLELLKNNVIGVKSRREAQRAVQIVSTELAKIITKTFVGLANQTNGVFTAGGMIEERSALETAIAQDKHIDGVFCFIESRRILLRTPPLPHQFKSAVYLNSGRNRFPVTHTNAFKGAVGRVLEQEKEMILLPEFRKQFARRTLFYLHVVQPGETAMDSDNRDTKGITDVISSFFPGGDCAGNCRFVGDSVSTGEVPAGTYITVFPYEDTIPKNEELISYWKKRLMEMNYTGIP